MITKQSLTQIDNNTFGNPRYVIHWTAIANNYAIAVAMCNKIGGRKYHNKKYGGGIVFATWHVDVLLTNLNNITNKQHTPQ